MRERLRSWIRDFLGLPALESAVSRVDESLLVIATDLPSLTMFKAMEQKQAERHLGQLKACNDVLAGLEMATRQAHDYEAAAMERHDRLSTAIISLMESVNSLRDAQLELNVRVVHTSDRKVPLYTDYEFSQVSALRDFEQDKKEN